MRAKIQKNEAYSKLMLDEGGRIPSDEDSDFVMELPSWADKEKIKLGQWFVMFNFNAMSHALAICLMSVSSIPSILKVLAFTKQSSTPALAYRRFKMNSLHAAVWYQYPIEEGSKAWKSLATIRKIHVVVGKKSEKAGIGNISQKDMAITQFVFMGFPMLRPDQFGFVATREEFEAFNHLWRVLGFMLGIEDRFNCCGETVEETLSRLESMRVDMMLPELKLPNPEFDNFVKVAAEGLWYSDPMLHYDSLMFMTKRCIGVPGYHILESEAVNGTSRKVLSELSAISQFRILLDFVVYEYLSHVFVFRWIFNISRLVMVILDKYSVLSSMRFGKKYANVEIMKSNK